MKNKKTLYLTAVLFLIFFFALSAKTQAAPDPASSKFQSLCECVDKNNKTVYKKDKLKTEGECMAYCKNYPFFRYRYTNDGVSWFYGQLTTTTAASCAKAGGNCQDEDKCDDIVELDDDNCANNEQVCCKVSSTTTADNSGNISFPNPISANNANELFGNILDSLRGVVAIISIIFIIIGGIMYMAAAGSEKMIDKAKATITGAVVGLAIVMAAPAFLKQILDVLGASDQSGQLAGALSIKQIATNVLNFLLSVTGIIAIISLIAGGAFYLTAYGDEDRIKKGKEIIKYSIIGIVVASASLVIVKQLAALIGMAP